MSTPYIPYLRQMVGHARIMAIGVTVLLINEKEEILVEKRADNGLYCLPGGSLDLDETVLEGMHRELQEETGIDVTNFVLFSIRSGSKTDFRYPNGDITNYVDLNFISHVHSQGIHLKSDGESTSLQFLPLSQLPDPSLWTPGTWSIVEKYQSGNWNLTID